MSDKNIDKIASKDMVQRYEEAKSVRDQWRSQLDDIFHYIQPDRNMFDQHGVDVNTPGEKKNVDVYDMTAVNSSVNYTSKLHSTLTPPFVRWAKLISGTEIPDSAKDNINKELELATEVLFNYIQNSSFDLAISECYSDLVAGTAILKVDEGDDETPLLFSSSPIHTIALEEDSRGRLRNIWRDHDSLKIRQIEALWPDAKLTTKMTSAKKRDPERGYDLYDGTIYNEKDKNYSYFVALKDGNNIIYEATYKSSPWVAFRMSRLPGDVYGRGVGGVVLPAVKTLNKIIEYVLKGAAFSVMPTFMGFNDDVFNPDNMVLEPGTVISISQMSSNRPPLIPLDIKPNIQFADLIIKDSRQAIKEAFIDEPLGAVTDPTKTATEVSFRERLLLEKIGSSFGRLQAEFFGPLIDRCLYILNKKALIDDIKVDGRVISIKYASPLAKTQDEDDLNAFVTATQTIEGVTGDPKLTLAALNLPAVVPFIAEKSGAKLTLFKTSEEMQKTLDDLQKAALQEAQQPPAQQGNVPGQPPQQPQQPGDQQPPVAQ